MLGGPQATWGSYLRRIVESTTRLHIRSRWPLERGLLHWLGLYGVLEPTHIVMERKTLLGIKQRAEAWARERKAGAEAAS